MVSTSYIPEALPARATSGPVAIERASSKLSALVPLNQVSLIPVTVASLSDEIIRKELCPQQFNPQVYFGCGWQCLT